METTHHIQSQKFELEFLPSADQHQLLNLICDVIYQEVNPALEQLFREEKFLDETTIKEEKLVLDVGALNENNWQQELKMKTVEAMKSWLASKKPMYEVNKGKPPVSNRKDDFSKPIESKPAQDENYFLALIYFLENGFLPWYFSHLSMDSISQYLSLQVLNITTPLYKNENFVALVKLMFESPFMLYRFKEQFHPMFLRELTLQLNRESSILDPIKLKKNDQKVKWHIQLAQLERLEFVASIIHWYASMFKSDFESYSSKWIHELSLILDNEHLDSEKNDMNISQRMDSLLINRSSDIKFPERNKIENEKTTSERVNSLSKSPSSESASLFIHNAGLVLLHPYISMLFHNLHYTNENHEWIDETMRMKAPLLLQYLVTGQTQYEEHALVFNKFLCGIPFHEPVLSEIQLTEEDINSCQKLLESVIAHWTILKSTSIDGLRNSFLMRNGKLSKEEIWQLTVENKAWDVLLAQLPWGISMVKTPWMEELLYVNWT